jgi:hypothetical protein
LNISYLIKLSIFESKDTYVFKIISLSFLQLIIDSIDQTHNGTYVCVASNQAGTLDVEVQVTVMGECH